MARKPQPSVAATGRTAGDGGRRTRRFLLVALTATALALAMSGCVIIKSNSSTQLNSIGKVQIRTTACASDKNANYSGYNPPDSACQGPTKGGNADITASDNQTIQLKIAYRIPDNVTAPSSFTSTNTSSPPSTPCGGGITFSQSPSYSSALQSGSPAGSGKRWVGYLSNVLPSPYTRAGCQYFTVSPEFTLQQGADGAPFQGPFNYRVVVGYRTVNQDTPGDTSSRPVTCGSPFTDWYLDGSSGNQNGTCADSPTPSEISSDLSQTTRDLGVVAGSPASVHAGAAASVPFNLKYAGAAGAGPFAISASSNVPGAATIPSRSYSEAVLARSPALYWRLGESSGTTAADASGNGRVGTYAGATLGAAGALVGDPNTAVNLSSTGRVTSTYAPFASGSVRSFAFWARQSTATTSAVFLGGPNSTSPSLFTGTASPNNGTGITWRVRNSDTGSTSQTSWAGAWPGTGQNVFVVLIFNESANTAELFVNGVSQGVKTGLTQTYSSPGNLRAGHATTAVNGAIDEFAAFTSALTPAQILDLCNVGKGQASLTPAADSDNNINATVFVPANTTPGIYNVTVTATGSGEASGQVRSNTNTLTVGESFTFDPAPSLPSLGTIALTGQAQTKTARMNDFGVNDTTGSASGWNVTVVGDSASGKSNVFKQYCPNSGGCGGHPFGYVSGGYTLPANSLTLDSSGASWAGGSGTAPSFQCNSGCSVDRSTAIKVVSAPAGGGTGLWSASGFGSSSLSLAVPSTLRALPASEQYRVNVVWSLNSGP